MLLLYGIVGFCLAARTERLSSQGNGRTERRLQVNQSRSYYTENGFLSPENSFTLNLECGPWNPEKCEMAKYVIGNVSLKIANEILLRAPISISIQVDSEVTLASFGNTFRTIAAQKVDSRGTGANYSYPQALVKQASVDALPSEDLNHILTYAFESDISFKIGSKTFDPLNEMRFGMIGDLESKFF